MQGRRTNLYQLMAIGFILCECSGRVHCYSAVVKISSIGAIIRSHSHDYVVSCKYFFTFFFSFSSVISISNFSIYFKFLYFLIPPLALRKSYICRWSLLLQCSFTAAQPACCLTFLPETHGDGQRRREGSGAVSSPEEAQPAILLHPTAGQLDSGKQEGVTEMEKVWRR